jgi:hypothetical protein
VQELLLKSLASTRQRQQTHLELLAVLSLPIAAVLKPGDEERAW